MLDYFLTAPEGWLREYLATQMTGLTGHIGEAGYPFSIVEWGQEDYHNTDENPNWWVYEQTGYWVDGYVRCAILLNDDEVAIENAKRIIYNVIENPDVDGYLGPAVLKDPVAPELEPNGKISCIRWPHVIFFRAVIALYEYNHDENLINALVNHYLNSPFDYTRGRNAQNLEIICWLYTVTQKSELLEMAEHIFKNYRLHEPTENLMEMAVNEEAPTAHGVSFCEFFKLGAILYNCTGKEEYLNLSTKAANKLVQYAMLPDGCPSSQEAISGNDPMGTHETCVITDYTWSLEKIMAIAPKAEYCDCIERCMFNAAPGAVLENFRGLQYFSGANQILCDNQSSYAPGFRCAKMMSYRPNPGTECCPGNVNRAMPNFAMSMWAKQDDTYYACLLGPCKLTDGGVSIHEITNYPFEDSVRFEIHTDKVFHLNIRYPSWYSNCRLFVNGIQGEITIQNGFISVKIERNCCLELIFEAAINKVSAAHGVYFTRGPLVYSLGQKGIREIDFSEERSSPEFPAFNISPHAKWKYGVLSNGIAHYIPSHDAHCFDLDQPLPHLVVDAVEIKNLDFRHVHISAEELKQHPKTKYIPGDYIWTPDILSEEDALLGEKTQITLSPYGACKLRMTVFTEITKQE